MTKRSTIGAVSPEALRAGYLAFQKRERRDAMYKTAAFLVEHWWGKSLEVAESLGVLVLHWNHAFYRYGPFDYDALEYCIADNESVLNGYRKRDILSHRPKDDPKIKSLFEEFLDSLRICEGKMAGRSSPVAVAKALHLLAPRFFPLWDQKIAIAYGCYYGVKPADKYISFLSKTQDIAASLAPSVKVNGKTLLKLIDEYNYAKYTKQWVK